MEYDCEQAISLHEGIMNQFFLFVCACVCKAIWAIHFRVKQ